VELRDRRIENIREKDVMNYLRFKIQKLTKGRRNFTMKNFVTQNFRLRTWTEETTT